MSSNTVKQVESEIDAEVKNTPLLEISYAQAMWTVLSNIEDGHLKSHCIDKLEDKDLHVYVDIMINTATYPLREIYLSSNRTSVPLVIGLNDDHYGWAHEWIEKAKKYYNYCSIFPLWHRNKITLTVDGYELNTSDWKNQDLRYEAYNRLVRKDGDNINKRVNPQILLKELLPNSICNETTFELRLNPKLAKILIEHLHEVSNDRYKLPDDWECSKFNFGQFKAVYTAIKAILTGRFILRSYFAMQGMVGLGYSSSVWVVTEDELIARLARYVRVEKSVVQHILKYLTFGEMGINYPDIATQPLVNLENGFLALSPLLWNHTDAERNLCVLLNQIPIEREIYSRLSNKKEDIIYKEIEDKVLSLGYEIASGELGDTDLDIAIIDRSSKICVCLELKWFIEPAEIRETIQRAEELEKGVDQALKIFNKYIERDNILMNEILKIDDDYSFFVAVGSKNWIGDHSVQNENVPIIKIQHFLDKISELGSLEKAAIWLKDRDYLPKESINFEIVPTSLEFGKWSATWYGIKPVA